MFPADLGDFQHDNGATADMFSTDVGNREQESGSSDSIRSFIPFYEQIKAKKGIYESEAMQGRR